MGACNITRQRVVGIWREGFINSAFDATTIVEEEAKAKCEAERRRLGLVNFTDGSRTEDGCSQGSANKGSGHSVSKDLRR